MSQAGKLKLSFWSVPARSSLYHSSCRFPSHSIFQASASLAQPRMPFPLCLPVNQLQTTLHLANSVPGPLANVSAIILVLMPRLLMLPRYQLQSSVLLKTQSTSAPTTVLFPLGVQSPPQDVCMFSGSLYSVLLVFRSGFCMYFL